MINDLNDPEMCDHWNAIKRNFELAKQAWPMGANRTMFLALHNMEIAIDNMKWRLNDLLPKGPNP